MFSYFTSSSYLPLFGHHKEGALVVDHFLDFHSKGLGGRHRVFYFKVDAFAEHIHAERQLLLHLIYV